MFGKSYDPICQTNMFFQPKINLLGMAHSNALSSIRNNTISALNSNKQTKTMFSYISNVRCLSEVYLILLVSTCVHTFALLYVLYLYSFGSKTQRILLFEYTFSVFLKPGGIMQRDISIMMFLVFISKD